MSTIPPVTCATQIGDVAGTIWRTLSQDGPLTLAKLVKAVGEPRDVVMQGLGWLAREGKIRIGEEGRNRVVYLQE
jgi:hypothetical protein